MSELLCGCTLTLPTAKLEIVTADVPCFPSTVAVMVAEPTATALTTPWFVTVATAASDVDHATGRPVNTAPLASRATADICVVWLADIDSLLGSTATVAT